MPILTELAFHWKKRYHAKYMELEAFKEMTVANNLTSSSNESVNEANSSHKTRQLVLGTKNSSYSS